MTLEEAAERVEAAALRRQASSASPIAGVQSDATIVDAARSIADGERARREIERAYEDDTAKGVVRATPTRRAAVRDPWHCQRAAHNVRHATAACTLSRDRTADSTAGAQMARALQRVARMSVADLASACEGASLEDLAARVDEAATASGASADDFADDEAVAMAVECAAAIADGDADAVHDVASAAIAEAEDRTCVRDALVRALVKTEQIDGTDAQLLASLDTERAAEILAAAGPELKPLYHFIRTGAVGAAYRPQGFRVGSLPCADLDATEWADDALTAAAIASAPKLVEAVAAAEQAELQ